MSNPYAPGGQDPWNQGNGQGGFPGSQQSYGQADPNAYAQGGYVDQTQQMSNGYMDQYPAQYGAGMTPEEPKSKLPLIIGGIAGVLVLILVAVGLYFFMSSEDEEEPEPDDTTTSATTDPSPSTSAPAPSPSTSAPAPSPSSATSKPTTGPTGVPNPNNAHQNGTYSVDLASGVHVEITKIEKGPADKEGSDTIVVTYSMTNNSNEEQSDLFNTPSLKQKGIDMRPAYYAKGKEPAGYDTSYFVNVPVGQTKTFQKAYKLPYPNEVVSFKTTDFDNFDADIPDWYWQP